MKVCMYSCLSGICFLNPASTRNCAAKKVSTTVMIANRISTTGRWPNTRRSAKRWKALAGLLLELAALIASPSFGLEATEAVLAGDQQGAVGERQHAGNDAGRLVGTDGQDVGSAGPMQDGAVGADDDRAAV